MGFEVDPKMMSFSGSMRERPPADVCVEGVRFRALDTDETFILVIDKTGAKVWLHEDSLIKQQLRVAIAALERLADEQHMDECIASASRFGSAGAGIAYQDVRKYARETLDKINAVKDTDDVPTNDQGATNE